MSEEFEINEVQSTFDFKGFLFKLLSYWPLFLISLAIAFGVAYYINVRKLPVYRMQNLISIKDDQNPFFTTFFLCIILRGIDDKIILNNQWIQ